MLECIPEFADKAEGACVLGATKLHLLSGLDNSAKGSVA